MSVTWREVAFCHCLPATPLLSGTTEYYRMRRSQRICGISSDLQLCGAIGCQVSGNHVRDD
eukprot:1340592-Amorphochlora_amoeboformis.AAC.1